MSYFWCTKELSQNILPTYKAVLLVYFGKTSNSVEKFAFSHVSYYVAARIMDVYCKASIPIVSHERVVKLIKDYHNYFNLTKSFNHDKRKINYRTKFENLLS